MMTQNCKECNKTFTKRKFLNLHIKSAHGNQIRPYLCINAFCDFTFARKHHLDKHEMSCGKEKEFSCDKCDLKTKSSSYLKRHKENVHHGIIYPCSHCEYKAKHKHDLDNHSITKHDDTTMDCEKCSYKAQN